MDDKTKKMKIIRVCTHDISLGGLLKGQLAFLNQHFEVVGLSADTGQLQQVAEREGIRVIEVPMHREIALGADWKCLWQLRRIFRQERPDVVHANTPKGSLLSMIAARMAGVKSRVYLVTGLRYQGASGMGRFILKNMERITCFFASKVIPEGEGVKRILQKDHITRKPLEVVHHGNINGIDTQYFSREATVSKHGTREQVREKLGLTPDDFAFVFIGRMAHDKGMHELAEATRTLKKRYPHLRIILVGRFEQNLDPIPEEDKDFFEHDEAVRFVGYQTDVRPFLLAADALAFPSFREGFPNVVMQAGAMSLPLLVTDISGCTDIVTDGENGIVIPPRDAQALTEKMEYLMLHPEECRKMAEAARPSITSRYEQKDVWQALLKMYNSLNEKK